MGKALKEFDRARGLQMNRVFYLSTAPEFFPVIAAQARPRRVSTGRARPRRGLVIEKPFGYDLASARKLNAELLKVFDESQVFRIDHYLGKETVQNMMALRFANALFEPVWNRNFIDNIQITAAEDIGIEGRAGYYDHAGALRDLVQNHMLQLLALLTMEPPSSFDANKRARREAQSAAGDLPPPAPGGDRRGPSAPSTSPGGTAATRSRDTTEEEGSPPTRAPRPTQRFGCRVSNWRWAGVPIYLRTGKRLARKVTEIVVTLKPVPHLAFKQHRFGGRAAQPDHPHRPARRGRVALAGREDPRAHDAHPTRVHGVPLWDLVHVRVARGLRAADPRCDARRARRCSRATTRSRPCGESSIRS